MKHRFIDAIINFNFDELLDQAIDDEVGRGNYYSIVSDGDLPDDISKLQDRNQRFSAPLYVKPHGTASHRSSMRFTREAYFLLPENIRHLLSTLLSHIPTTLVLIGFSMQSVEFTNIVETAGENLREVFVIDPEAEVLQRIPTTIKSAHIAFTKAPKSLGELLNDLWKSVCECCREEALPRGVQRHRLISTFFSERLAYEYEEAKRTDLIPYLKDRTIIELALAIAKAKGFVNVGQLAISRAGRYYQYYREYETNRAETLYSLSELTKVF